MAINKYDPSLLDVIEPCIWEYRCNISLLIADDVSDKNREVAEKILMAIDFDIVV